MLQLDANIVAVSLPSITKTLHASFAGVEWVITAYTLAFASLMMPAGAFADRYGRKPALIAGLALFTIASFFCGAAASLPTLIAARALQGAGAAMQLSAGLATLSHSFSGPARARAFSFWGSVVGAGISLGPVVGGIITQSFGWQWAFYVNLPIGAAAIVLTVLVISNSKDPHATRLDLVGVITFGCFLFLTTLALISGNRDGWTNAAILVEFGAAAALLAAFVAVERYQIRPMLDFSFFRIPTYLGASLAQFTFAAGLLTMLTYMPIYFQGAMGYSPRSAGLAMLPMALPLFIVPPLVSRVLARRMSGRSLLTVGLLLISAGLGGMALAAGIRSSMPLAAAMLMTGIGAGILNGETTKVGMTVIPPERAGMASGLSGTIRFTGLVVGFAALGVVLYSRIAAVLQSSFRGGAGIDHAALVRTVASGQLPSSSPVLLHAFTEGFEALLLAGAGLTLVAALATWRLVRADDTLPIAPGKRAG